MAEKQVEYSLRKNPPLGQTRQSKYHPVLANVTTVDLRQLCSEISHATTCTSSDVLAVLDALVQSLRSHLSSGRRVTIDGLGSFVAKIESEEPIRYTDDKSIARHLRFTGVNFTPKQELVSALQDVAFRRSIRPPKSARLSDEEIVARLRAYVEETGETLINKRAFCAATGYSMTRADRELPGLVERGILEKTCSPRFPYYKLLQ